MSSAISSEFLMLLAKAAPEDIAEIERFLRSKCESDSPQLTLRAARSHPKDAEICPTARFAFRKAGSHWDVVFDGSNTFHLPDKLGTRYISYFLHHANEPVSAFDVERMIQPEKAEVRAKDSIQDHLDAGAVRAYLRQLDTLREQRAEAAEDGDLARADQLDDDITAIEAALKQPGQAADAGERARGNVSKAVKAVLRGLHKGDAVEQAFGRHLEQAISLGYECCYHQPPGISWTAPRPGNDLGV
jgi:hypothetical protein